MAGTPVMQGDSFTFNSINSYTEYGIKVIKTDVFFPPKRDRREEIPRRHGTYDYGKKWFSDRYITLDCCTETKQISSRPHILPVSKWLAGINRLYLWDDPERYYIAECLEAATINVLPKYTKQQFTLTFHCQPFSRGKQVIQPIKSGNNNINYEGTAETPTLIVLRNATNNTINNIKLTLIQRVPFDPHYQ